MNKKKNCFALKQAGIVMLACLICIWGLSGCRKNLGPETGSRTAQETAAPTLEQESTLTPIKIPTPTPTPIPAPWESYERIGERSVFKVPVKELEDGVQIAGSSAAGGYVLLQIMDRKTDIVGPEWAPIILLRPAESGKAVSYTPVFPVRSVNVLADGTVFLEDAGNGAIHVFDRFFNETGSIVSEEDTAPILMAVTDDGHLWRFDYDTKRLSICDRNGENLKYFENDAGRRIFQDLGGKDGKRYFLAMDSDEYNSDVILYADADTGVVTEQDEHILNVTIAEYPSFFPNSGGILYDISNETWYLHLISDSGRRIALPRHYQYETIEFRKDNILCVSGYIWGADGSQTSWIKPGGCRVYDIENGNTLGELSTLDLARYKSLHVLGMQENGLMLVAAGNPDDDGNQNEDLLLWDVSGQEPSRTAGFFDLTEETPEECFRRLAEEYLEIYGISYEPGDMKTVTCGEEFVPLQRMDFLNRIARGIAGNPEEFPKGEDGISVRVENIRAHERGHSRFEPHIFSDISKEFYGEEQAQSFFNLVDALRAGEDTFESKERILYNWSMTRFATWYYPVASACISTSYNFYDAEEWKKGRGVIHYTVPKEEAAELMREFEQLVCDILDDCFSDDYTDFEKALALYEYITTNWTYDYDMYEHINDFEWTNKGSVYRCFKEYLGICWEIAGVYEYLLLQCGINAEDADGTNTDLNELHAWAYVMLDGNGYNIDPTWGLSSGRVPQLDYFCITDKVREERDHFPFETCFVIGTDEMKREEKAIIADNERYAPLWGGYYIGMDRVAKRVLYEDNEGVLHGYTYEDRKEDLTDNAPEN